jgi:hypothetical protein
LPRCQPNSFLFPHSQPPPAGGAIWVLLG